MAAIPAEVEGFINKEYKHGFSTKVETSRPVGKGLNEAVVRRISMLRGEPVWLTNFRVDAYRGWVNMKEPKWSRAKLPEVDFSKIAFFSEPKKKPKVGSLDEVDPEVLKTFAKLGIPMDEQKRLANVATDVVFDSTSVVTTFRDRLKKSGVIFCSMKEAVANHPDLVKQHLGTVVSKSDNYWAALNAAVFSDGSFVYIPKNVVCPMELSTYFRINDEESGQFERTLVVADEGSKVSYLEGCTAPSYQNHQLHAAVVELVAKKSSTIDYSTVQNWYPGTKDTGKGGVLNYVTKRGLCKGDYSKIRWSQVEVGSAVTWKYPSCVLSGKGSSGEFHSVSLTTGKMQADTGTKMIHIGDDTRSNIVSKSISAGSSLNVFRSLVSKKGSAKNVRSFSQCDSMLIGDDSHTCTVPIIKTSGKPSQLEHEASVSKLDEDQIQFLKTRGLDQEQAIRLVVGGFCNDVVKKLPLEFASEASALLGIKLTDSVG
eukprot:TRINITY_DN6427_c0_g2_i1.p1 TRINITY_DN6427_c0_g2~~TRINITY_DN6427_c0_g2_i1.p1  ORF type:complete len:484 (+),score=106.39 TRINITY_DN6427_c0_g2_i1:40-1491(+)